MIGFLVVVGVVLLLLVRRTRRKRMLAGLDSGKPVFQVEPPRRRLSTLKDGML